MGVRRRIAGWYRLGPVRQGNMGEGSGQQQHGENQSNYFFHGGTPFVEVRSVILSARLGTGSQGLVFRVPKVEQK